MNQSAACPFNEFNEKIINEANDGSDTATPPSHLRLINSPKNQINTKTLFPLPSTNLNQETLPTRKSKEKKMKKKQSDQMFMNQSVIYNHEGKKQRNKTIYSKDHPKVSSMNGLLRNEFRIGQEVNVRVCECKSEKKVDYFDRIIIEHLGFTNQHNMDPSKTTAVEFVNVLAFKRKSNDSKILWIYESIILDLMNNNGSINSDSCGTSDMNTDIMTPILKRKLDSMSESDESSCGNFGSSSETVEDINLVDQCFMDAANPYLMHQTQPILLEEQSKRSKLDTQIENIYLESVEPSDAPSKKSTLFQLSLNMSIEQPYHLFNPMVKKFYLDFVTLTEDQLAFDASIISVQPVFNSFNMFKGKEFQIIGKTPIITMYDSVNTFMRLCVDSEVFTCKNVNNEKLHFFFYGEDKRMRSEEIIQNPNIYSRDSVENSDQSNNTTPSATNDKASIYSDLILFELSSDDNFLFEQFKNVNLEAKKKSSCQLLFDRYLEFSRVSGKEEAIKSLIHIQDPLGFTLLMHFAARDMISETEICLQWGANINQRDSFGYDALFWSSYYKSIMVEKLLRKVVSEMDSTKGEEFDKIALDQQIRYGLVDASSRLEKRMVKRIIPSSSHDFSSSDEEETIESSIK